jgi:Spy/CpxP family protein refolding chaperone
MKKQTLGIAAALALVALIAAPFAFAQHERGMHGEAFGEPMFLGHLQHLKQELGLSDQQVSNIQAIFQDLRTQNQQYRQSMHSTMQQVAQILLNNPNDVAAAQALIDQQTNVERTMKTNALNAASKALNVLTPDQRSKLSTLIQERMGRAQKY